MAIPRDGAGIVLTLAGCATLALLIHLAAAPGRGLEIALTALGIPHAAAYLFLLGLFGRTLARGREPLVTEIARRIHGTLEPEIVAYTRRVTLAWCLFCAAQLALSAALFVLAPLDIWSLFVNVLNVPLLALMFAAEYGYRVTRYPNHPRASLGATMRAFARSG